MLPVAQVIDHVLSRRDMEPEAKVHILTALCGRVVHRRAPLDPEYEPLNDQEVIATPHSARPRH